MCFISSGVLHFLAFVSAKPYGYLNYITKSTVFSKVAVGNSWDILKGRPAYNCINSMPENLKQIIFKAWQSHHCWFVTNIWKSDYRLNMTSGTDTKFTLTSLSFLSAKLLCWWKWILSSFKTQKLWIEARTIWIQMGGAYLVMWTTLCVQLHAHRSLQHSKASC